MEEKILKLSEQLVDESTGSIEQLFHIAAMFENRDLAEMLSDMDYEDTREIIQGLTEKEFDGYGPYDRAFLFNEHDLNGFIAECNFNEPRDIVFKPDGQLRSSYRSGCSHIRYIYGDTMEDLISKTISVADKLYYEDIQKERDKRGIQLTESN